MPKQKTVRLQNGYWPTDVKKKGMKKTDYQRGYMRKWRKLQSLKRQFKGRVKMKYLREMAGLTCALLIVGCKTQPAPAPAVQGPPALPVIQHRAAAVPALTNVPPRSWDLPLQYPTNCASVQRWYLQQSTDARNWTNVWVPPVGYFAGGCPGTNSGSYTVHWDPTNYPVMFWRLKGI